MSDEHVQILAWMTILATLDLLFSFTFLKCL